MKHILCYVIIILAFAACRPGGDPIEQPQPETNIMVHNGNKSKLTKLFVYVDTVYGRFYDEHLYSYEFVLLSEGFNVTYDSEDFTSLSGKGDFGTFEIVSDQNPPRDGNYIYSEDEDPGKLMFSAFSKGYDVALDSSDQEIETGTGSALKFATKNASSKEYRLEINSPQFNGVFEGPFVIFKGF